MPSTTDSDSGPDDIEPVKKKGKIENTKTKIPTKEKKDNSLMQLGRMRYISVSEWKGKSMVNIREYYTNDAGEMKPGKKGISLSLDQWTKLKDHIPDIDAQIKE
ncbi:unnamed protein product [Gordionus sp. m RMFG-2023]|uniref:activated RNA polymerase II transcriptional coactivator p15-like n=1 Tax=Gordionus sp. m RMFG-2023 TaxID=3053472 RepID=UPI0030E4F2B9